MLKINRAYMNSIQDMPVVRTHNTSLVAIHTDEVES